jgi:hypothetical protein
MAGFVFAAARFEDLNEPIVDVFGQRLRVHAFVDLNRLLGSVADHPAIGALADMALQVPAHGGIDILVEEVA